MFVLVVLWFLFLSNTVVTGGDIVVPFVALIETGGGVGGRVTSSTGLVYWRQKILKFFIRFQGDFKMYSTPKIRVIVTDIVLKLVAAGFI